MKMEIKTNTQIFLPVPPDWVPILIVSTESAVD